MAAIDESGLPVAEQDAVRDALERDPALARELEMILEALDPGAREAFWRAFAAAALVRDRPAAAVLEALTEAARAPRD